MKNEKKYLFIYRILPLGALRTETLAAYSADETEPYKIGESYTHPINDKTITILKLIDGPIPL